MLYISKSIEIELYSTLTSMIGKIENICAVFSKLGNKENTYVNVLMSYLMYIRNSLRFSHHLMQDMELHLSVRKGR